MRWAQLMAIAGGVVLMLAPSSLGYRETPAADVHWTVGPLLITFGIIASWQVLRAMRWLVVPLAAVLLAAPLVSGHSRPAWIVAVVVAAATAISAPHGGTLEERVGGGWRALIEQSPTR